MNVIVDFCLVPLGVGVSVSKYIAECEKILTEAGLKTQMHAYGTNIEGEWDEVFSAINTAMNMCMLWVYRASLRRLN